MNIKDEINKKQIDSAAYIKKFIEIHETDRFMSVLRFYQKMYDIGVFDVCTKREKKYIRKTCDNSFKDVIC